MPRLGTCVESGRKLCDSFHSEQEYEKQELQAELETVGARWKAVAALLEDVACKGQQIHKHFATFLGQMSSVAQWLYTAVSKLLQAEGVESTDGTDDAAPGSMWSVVQEVERGLLAQRSQLDNLRDSMLPWQRLPFLEEDSSAFPMPFKEEVTRHDEMDSPDAEGVGPAETQEGVEVLTRKCLEVEKQVHAMRYGLESKSEHITTLLGQLDDVLRWILKQESERMGLKTVPTPDVGMVKAALEDLKVCVCVSECRVQAFCVVWRRTCIICVVLCVVCVHFFQFVCVNEYVRYLCYVCDVAVDAF